MNHSSLRTGRWVLVLQVSNCVQASHAYPPPPTHTHKRVGSAKVVNRKVPELYWSLGLSCSGLMEPVGSGSVRLVLQSILPNTWCM